MQFDTRQYFFYFVKVILYFGRVKRIFRWKIFFCLAAVVTIFDWCLWSKANKNPFSIIVFLFHSLAADQIIFSEAKKHTLSRSYDGFIEIRLCHCVCQPIFNSFPLSPRSRSWRRINTLLTLPGRIPENRQHTVLIILHFFRCIWRYCHARIWQTDGCHSPTDRRNKRRKKFQR